MAALGSYAPIAQWLERAPYKRVTGVRLTVGVPISPIRSIAGKVVVFPLGNLYGALVKWPKTPPFHGGNTGSKPVGVTTCRNISKISHYSKPGAWVTNPTAAAMVALTRKSLVIKRRMCGWQTYLSPVQL